MFPRNPPLFDEGNDAALHASHVDGSGFLAKCEFRWNRAENGDPRPTNCSSAGNGPRRSRRAANFPLSFLFSFFEYQFFCFLQTPRVSLGIRCFRRYPNFSRNIGVLGLPNAGFVSSTRDARFGLNKGENFSYLPMSLRFGIESRGYRSSRRVLSTIGDLRAA